MKNTTKRILVLAALLTAAVSVMLTASSCSKDEIEEQTQDTEQVESAAPEKEIFPELEILNTTDTKDGVVVETTYGTFRYPYAFSDIVSVNAVNGEESAQLQVSVIMEDSSFVVYTIHYNEEIGSVCGKLKLDGYEDEIDVSVEFEEASDAVPEDWLTTVYAVQETFNDVINSMSEDSRFTLAD
ncbi:MAG: hypothetical protein IJ325_05795 [Clostridia bacterium]|nr:hypothetical protein [Clostridia bacterium]